jgi:cytochrome c5
MLAIVGLSLAVSVGSQPASGQNRERSGQEVVRAVCAACHATGAKGAPKIGDRQAWAKLASRGLASLTNSALKGVRNMPAHGGSPSVTDGEIERAITYMVNRSGGNWVEPTAEVTSAAERRGKEIVDAQCAKCHGTGVNGAPKIGDSAAWIKRLSRGLDVVVRSAVNGHGPMPPRGGVASLTDSEIRAAVIYMFNPASAVPKEPAAPAPAADANRKIVGNMEVYLGVLPAETIRARHAPGDPETLMHGGIPSGEGYYHVNVSLLDRKTKAEITGARVEARVAEPVMGGETKVLDPIAFNNARSYGNYFRMQGKQPYTITLRITPPGSSRVYEAKFDYRRY